MSAGFYSPFDFTGLAVGVPEPRPAGGGGLFGRVMLYMHAESSRRSAAASARQGLLARIAAAEARRQGLEAFAQERAAAHARMTTLLAEI